MNQSYLLNEDGSLNLEAIEKQQLFSITDLKVAEKIYEFDKNPPEEYKDKEHYREAMRLKVDPKLHFSFLYPEAFSQRPEEIDGSVIDVTPNMKKIMNAMYGEATAKQGKSSTNFWKELLKELKDNYENDR